jgi:hypothetical protein
MNFLQLCQRACTDCGVASNSPIATMLPTVVGATGSLGRVVNWVGDAWNELQEAHDDWDWMRSSNILSAPNAQLTDSSGNLLFDSSGNPAYASGSGTTTGVAFQTVAGQASYPLGTGLGTVGVPVDSFGKWDRETFRNYTTTVGFRNEMFLDEVSFDEWRDGYMLGAMRSVETRPVVFAVGPDQSVCLGPPPNGLYTITADYFVAPSLMVEDPDIPVGLPTRFHMLIVYFAMLKYGAYEAAEEVSQRGASESARMYARLQAVRAPRMVFGGTLA